MKINNTQKDFILGDEWFYIKIYTGVKTADYILTETIEPLANKLMEEKLMSKWFFIRYTDPGFHLRIRFQLKDTVKLSTAINYLNTEVKPFLENLMIFKFQTEIYSRELERYGYSTIDESESIFFHDSQSTIQMLNLIEGDEGEIYRWHFACLSVDYLLNDFGFSEKEKLVMLDKLQQGFGQEFGMNTQLQVQLDDKFRKERQKMRSFLLREDDFYRPFYQILEQKSTNTKSIIDKIKELQSMNELEVDFDGLIGSYIHMMLNRIFKSKQRLHEMVIYSLLYRFYKSEMARKSKSSLIN